jgi:LUD domain
MNDPILSYWQKRLDNLKVALEANNFEVYRADSAGHAKAVVVQEILPKIDTKSVSWGGSKTLFATGLCDYFKENGAYQVIDTFDRTVSREEMAEQRRRALLTDLFLTGANAVTESGQLVNLDMVGNRIGGITFGPNHVIILLGRNKLTADLDEAMFRIKNYAAPVNAMRLGMKTPCVKTSICEECKSPQRICNTWCITEKSLPKGRIKVVLINEDLGF